MPIWLTPQECAPNVATESAGYVARLKSPTILGPPSRRCFCNSPQMNVIEAYIQFTPGLITSEGVVTRPSTEEFLRNYMNELYAFIGRVYTVLPRPT